MYQITLPRLFSRTTDGLDEQMYSIRYIPQLLLFSRLTYGLDEQMYQIMQSQLFSRPTDGLDEQMYQKDHATSTFQQTD
jgi:hypothetical protein